MAAFKLRSLKDEKSQPGDKQEKSKEAEGILHDKVLNEERAWCD